MGEIIHYLLALLLIPFLTDWIAGWLPVKTDIERESAGRD